MWRDQLPYAPATVISSTVMAYSWITSSNTPLSLKLPFTTAADMELEYQHITIYFFLLKTKITEHACVYMHVYVHRYVGEGQRSTSGSIPLEEYILLFESFIGLKLTE